MEEIVGTVYSSAPELLRGDYDNKADLWSVGVIAYMLRSGGKMPFQEKWRRFLIEKIQRAEYSFEDKCWDSVPVESKNFIASLLELDPTKRPTAEDALKNLDQLEEAISSPEELNSSSKVAEEVLDGLVKRKKTEFRRSQNTPLKNIALMAIAHYSDAEDIVNLRTAFQEYDQGGDGVINASEFKAAIQKYRKSFDETQADDLFRELVRIVFLGCFSKILHTHSPWIFLFTTTTTTTIYLRTMMELAS